MHAAESIHEHERREADIADGEVAALEWAGRSAQLALEERDAAAAVAAARQLADRDHAAALWEAMLALVGQNGGDKIPMPIDSDIYRYAMPARGERLAWAVRELERLAACRRRAAAEHLTDVASGPEEIRLRRATAALRRLAKRYAAPAKEQP